MDKRTEKLLRRASRKLQDYCERTNGDMNDSLSEEIDRYLFLQTECAKHSEGRCFLLSAYIAHDTVPTFSRFLIEKHSYLGYSLTDTHNLFRAIGEELSA